MRKISELKYLNGIIVTAVLAFSIFITVKETATKSIFYGDSLGYYAYLPAFFIHDNLDHIQDVQELETISDVAKQNIPYWKDNYSVNQEGNVIIQYTYGTAGMNAPFFLIAHVVEKMRGAPADGYSNVYEWGIRVGNYIYTFLGLLLLYRWGIKNSFDKQLTLFSLLAVFWGTNLWWFTVYQSGMAHINLFFLIAALIYISQRYWDDRRKMDLWILGFILGWITVLRPTDIIVGLVPLLYGVQSRTDWSIRWAAIKTDAIPIIGLGFTGFIIPIIPQLAYWKLLTGDWIYYSYSEQGFNWMRPEIYRGLLGPNNGWWTYNPMMLIPFLAVFLPKVKSPIKIASLLIVPLYIYIIYSWWNYYYINGFGSRPMIHIYPLFAIALIAMLQSMKGWTQKLIIGLIFLLGLVNINYSYKEMQDWMYTDESYHAFNFATFFKNGIDYEDLVLRDSGVKQPSLKNKTLVKQSNIAKDSVVNIYNEFSDLSLEYILTEADLERDYISIGGEFMFPYVVYSTYEHHMLVLKVFRNDKQKVWKAIKLNNKVGKPKGKVSRIHEYIDKQWGEVYFNYPLAKLKAGDKLRAEFWNPRQKQMKAKSFDMYLADLTK